MCYLYAVLSCGARAGMRAGMRAYRMTGRLSMRFRSHQEPINIDSKTAFLHNLIHKVLDAGIHRQFHTVT